jgi:hypothetical protein
MNHQHFTEQARMRLANYNANQLSRALADCYETLKVGGYESDHPYGIKLWAEIDAIRERQMFLHKNKKPSKINSVET